jgi:hypothetical protein
LATSTADLWDTIVREAERESPLWRECLRPDPAREQVFSLVAAERFALGLETIYEGYLVHYGRPRLFQPMDEEAALLLGDYLYAHGLVRIAELGDVGAVRRLAELISLCSHLRAEGRPGDGEAWARTAAELRDGEPDAAAAAEATAAHGRWAG